MGIIKGEAPWGGEEKREWTFHLIVEKLKYSISSLAQLIFGGFFAVRHSGFLFADSSLARRNAVDIVRRKEEVLFSRVKYLDSHCCHNKA